MPRGFYPTRLPVQIVDLTQARKAQEIRAALAEQARQYEAQVLQQAHASEQAELRSKFVADVNQGSRVWRWSGPDRAELEVIAGKYRRQGLEDTSLPPMPIGSNTYLSVQQQKEITSMNKQEQAKRLASVMKMYGLDASNEHHMREVTNELHYANLTLTEGQDSAAAAEQAIERAARRLGAHKPGGTFQADTRDFKQRYFDSLTPAQRLALTNAQEYRASEEGQQAQQNELRARYVAEVQQNALDWQHGNRLDDRKAAHIAQRYQQMGLQDTALTREDLGQDDKTLLDNAREKITRNAGAQNYRPAFGYAGDSREQGHPMPGTAKGGK